MYERLLCIVRTYGHGRTVEREVARQALVIRECGFGAVQRKGLHWQLKDLPRLAKSCAQPKHVLLILTRMRDINFSINLTSSKHKIHILYSQLVFGEER